MTIERPHGIVHRFIWWATARRSLVMALMRFSRLSLFFGAKTAKNSGGTAGVFAVFCPPDPMEPRISAEHDASLADNSWEKQRKQRKPRNRGVQSSQSAPKTPFRGAVSRAGQNAALRPSSAAT